MNSSGLFPLDKCYELGTMSGRTDLSDDMEIERYHSGPQLGVSTQVVTMTAETFREVIQSTVRNAVSEAISQAVSSSQGSLALLVDQRVQAAVEREISRSSLAQGFTPRTHSEARSDDPAADLQDRRRLEIEVRDLHAQLQVAYATIKQHATSALTLQIQTADLERLREQLRTNELELERLSQNALAADSVAVLKSDLAAMERLIEGIRNGLQITRSQGLSVAFSAVPGIATLQAVVATSSGKTTRSQCDQMDGILRKYDPSQNEG